LTTGFLNKGKEDLLTPEVAGKLVKIKFLNGDCHYSQQEANLLSDWLSKEGPEKMRSFYYKHILSGFPQKSIQFQGSKLDRLFKKLCAHVEPANSAVA
jgi:hypothetical protein